MKRVLVEVVRSIRAATDVRRSVVSLTLDGGRSPRLTDSKILNKKIDLEINPSRFFYFSIFDLVKRSVRPTSSE